MEFSFDVNKVLPYELTLIRSKDIMLDISNGSMYKNNEMQMKLHLSKVIDNMGNASGKAQNLRGAITSALRMKSSDHHLYLLKEANANNGLGCVTGMIRIGFKHLFLLDIYGQQHECQPLCVLDFYVHESKQRHGYGKKIFNHMLHSEQVRPTELAIDRPSVKFLNFLARHYSLDKPIHQLNKFIVFDAFFKDMSAVGGIDAKSRRSAPVHRKMFARLSQHDSRYSASASINNVQRTSNRAFPDKISRQLSVLPPIKNCNENTSDNFGSSDRDLNQTPISRQYDITVLRPHNPKNSSSEIHIRNFSRHSVKKNSKSYPVIPAIHNNGGAGDEGLQCKGNVETTPLQTYSKQSRRQLTSLDNPLCEISPKVGSSSKDRNESYTVDNVLAKLNSNKEKLGTSWNVFGVPNMASNPYSSLKGRGFPK